VSKEVVIDEKPKSSSPDKPFTDDELSEAWSKLAESRKDQAATYQLLSRGFLREGNTLVIHLNNPVEEPLLQSMKTDLVSYLRESLGNNSLQLKSLMVEVAANKMFYTNKEKFDAMAAKNPLLKDLIDKFGLDPDF
jgi:DNA polymerase-3 subunit gamma/tau